MRRREVSGLGTILAALAVVPMAPAMAATWNQPEYTIQRALYGTPERNVDVTQRLRELAGSNERFILSNETFGIDPDKGRTKTLRIIATDPSGRTRTFEYTESSWVDGAQFSGWSGGNWEQGNPQQQGQGNQGNWGNRPGYHDGGNGGYTILQARYGTAERHVDVTQRLRDLARRNERFLLSNETFGVDPDHGRTKTLRIHARGLNGQMRTFEYTESSWVDGSHFSGWGSGNWGQGGDGNWGGGRPDVGGNGGGNYDNYGQGLRILRAEYGAGRDRMDIAERLQQLALNGRLNIKVDNNMAGGDPAEKRPKQLWITYSVNGRERSRVVPEGERLSIP